MDSEVKFLFPGLLGVQVPYFYLVKVGFDDFSWNSFLESSNFCYIIVLKMIL